MRTVAGQAAVPRWYFIPVRAVLVAFLLTLLSFAVSLLLGILGVVIHGRIEGVHPNMTVAYRHVALPTAAVVGAIALVAMTVLEIRNYRQSKVLAEIEHHSR